MTADDTGNFETYHTWHSYEKSFIMIMATSLVYQWKGKVIYGKTEWLHLIAVL
jgi:hypothetical protein